MTTTTQTVTADTLAQTLDRYAERATAAATLARTSALDHADTWERTVPHVATFLYLLPVTLLHVTRKSYALDEATRAEVERLLDREKRAKAEQMGIRAVGPAAYIAPNVHTPEAYKGSMDLVHTIVGAPEHLFAVAALFALAPAYHEILRIACERTGQPAPEISLDAVLELRSRDGLIDAIRGEMQTAGQAALDAEAVERIEDIVTMGLGPFMPLAQ